jgi:hypothetical protein
MVIATVMAMMIIINLFMQMLEIRKQGCKSLRLSEAKTGHADNASTFLVGHNMSSPDPCF